MPFTIGIDLGTTYSCAGIFRNGKVEIIPDSDVGVNTIPSFVAYEESGRIVGNAAKLQAGRNPAGTIFDAKRFIGRKVNDPSVVSDIKHVPFKVVEESGVLLIKPEYQTESGETKVLSFRPEEISAEVLRYIKSYSEKYLGDVVSGAVITVPAYFNDSQRQSTKDAGSMAGLNVLRVINEPTSACMAYGFDKLTEGEKNILVFDLGGGTFDVSLLNVSCEEGSTIFEVLSTAGNTHLGGEDFDNSIVRHLVAEFKRMHKIDISTNKRALSRLKSHAEIAKKSLSSSAQVEIMIDALAEGCDFSIKLTRARFEELCSEDFAKCLDPVNRVLSDAKMDKSKVDEVVMVGGSTRIPKVQKLLENYFNGKKLNFSINPDEAVAYGAAIQGAILSGTKDDKINNMVLIDVIPLSIGVEVNGQLMDVILKRGTSIPTKATRTYSTGMDNQPAVEIVVLEGERQLSKDNNILGRFTMEIPPARRGEPQIEVSLDIDCNSILKVSAMDKSSGKNQNITIKNDSNRLSPEEIEKKIKEAEEFAEQDAKRAEQIKAKSTFESMLYQVKSDLTEEGQKNEEITEKFNGYQSWLDSNQNATKEEFEGKEKELMTYVSGLPKEHYSNGDFKRFDEKRSAKHNGGGLFGDTVNSEPTIEEVD